MPTCPKHRRTELVLDLTQQTYCCSLCGYKITKAELCSGTFTSRPFKTVYQKYDFCKSVKCPELTLSEDGISYKCTASQDNCIHTAKGFHKWLASKKYKIIKGT